MTVRRELLPNPHTVTVIETCPDCEAKNRSLLHVDSISVAGFGFTTRWWAAPAAEADRPEAELDFSEAASLRRALVTDWAWRS